MKPVWIIALGVVLGGCALPQGETVAATTTVDSASPFLLVAAEPGSFRPAMARGSDCAAWRVRGGLTVCRDDVPAVQSAGAAEVPALVPERGQEIIGTEAHHLVLDGAS